MEEKEILAQVDYDISNQEEGIAFSLFQKRYTYKRNIINSVLFFLVGLLFIYRIIQNPDYTLAWILAGVCVVVIIFTWLNPLLIKKNLLKALKELEDTVYTMKLYEDCFSIELKQNEIIENDDEIQDDENNSEEPKKIPPRIMTFGKDSLDATETETLFTIFLKKQTIYTIPKRCMDSNTADIISSILSEKLQDGYKKVK